MIVLVVGPRAVNQPGLGQPGLVFLPRLDQDLEVALLDHLGRLIEMNRNGGDAAREQRAHARAGAAHLDDRRVLDVDIVLRQHAAEQHIDEVAARVQRNGVAAVLEIRIRLDLVGVHDEHLARAVVDEPDHPDVGAGLGGAHRGDDVGVADFGGVRDDRLRDHLHRLDAVDLRRRIAERRQAFAQGDDLRDMDREAEALDDDVQRAALLREGVRPAGQHRGGTRAGRRPEELPACGSHLVSSPSSLLSSRAPQTCAPFFRLCQMSRRRSRNCGVPLSSSRRGRANGTSMIRSMRPGRGDITTMRSAR